MPDDVRQDTHSFRLRELVEMAMTGHLRPAAFSRQQVWRSSQVIDLFDSILHGYPIGTLVAIEEPAPEEDVVFGNVTVHAPREDRALIVDGLQRITALVGVLHGMRSIYREKRFEVYYDVEQDKFVPGPFIRDSLLPVDIAANRPDLSAWIRERPFLSEREIDSCWRLSGLLNGYMIPVIVLAGADARSTALEVFTRINTSGAMLTKSELARARSSRFDTVELVFLERLQAEVERTGFGRMPIKLLLNVPWL